jgi:predicted HicB family RNase H-like nuclease
MTTTPKRPRGRPPLASDDPSIHLHVRVPGKDYAATREAADRARLSIGDWVRRALREARKGFSAP